jgi:cytochrome c biogenesis protein CcmG, thiol:disulfide interchange protein DsbE
MIETSGTESSTRSRRPLLYLLPVLLFIALAGYFAWALLSGRDPQQLSSALIGKPAPEFALPALLPGLPGAARADLGGKPVLVNFFASWCVPCRAEHPFLMELAKGADITIVGIVYKDKPEAAADLLLELGNPYDRIGQDVDGRTAIDFGVYGVPETFLVDAGGIVRFRQPGPLTPDVIERYLLPLLHSPGS